MVFITKELYEDPYDFEDLSNQVTVTYNPVLSFSHK